MSDPRESAVDGAPPDLFNEDGFVVATRIDGEEDTRGKARAFFASEWGVPFTAIRLRRTAYRFNVEHAEEAEADGIEEPYDGWPWIECEVGAPGAHPFWAFNDQDFSG